MDAVVCRGLTKRYGDVTALDHLDLAVPARTVFGFLGPNGAGKTTTVRLLAGLISPSAGQAWVNGQEVTRGAAAFRANMGFLPDVPAFIDWMTGDEFLAFVGELHGLPGREIRTRRGELLELVGLEESARRRIGGFSRGMKQRLGIAQALMSRPSLLIMDEPTSALDPAGRRDVLQLISRLGQDTTVFMSTHILSDVERVCQAVAIIDGGRLVAQSTVEELQRRQPRSTFEVEVEEDPTPLAEALAAAPWAAASEVVSVNGRPTLRVRAADLPRASRELPGIVAASGLTLLRYELARPGLEDIFVGLTGGDASRGEAR